MSDSTEYVTTREVATRIRRSVRWVIILIENGRIAAIQPGGERGHYLVPKSELERITRPVTPQRAK